MHKTSIKLIVVILAMACPSAYGSDLEVGGGYDLKTGDIELDTVLGDLNLHTRGQDLSDFASNLCLTYNLPPHRN
jgi:hypothetical protein